MNPPKEVCECDEACETWGGWCLKCGGKIEDCKLDSEFLSVDSGVVESRPLSEGRSPVGQVATNKKRI